MSVAGKTAVITGSTSGIGLGIAKGMAEAGANIVLNGFGDQMDIDRAVSDLEAFGVKVLYDPADMTKPDEIAAMMAKAEADFGAIDILVNNAGIQFVSPIEEFPTERWDAIVDINMNSNFHTIRAALPKMRERGWGRIINISSAHGIIASPLKSAYAAAKHGVVGLTRAVALETAQAGITCNAICPGYVWTPLVANQVPDLARLHGMTEEQVKSDVMLGNQWTKKFVEIDQLAGVALFLCSDAAQNITGVALPVDGGWSAS